MLASYRVVFGVGDVQGPAGGIQRQSLGPVERRAVKGAVLQERAIAAHLCHKRALSMVVVVGDV